MAKAKELVIVESPAKAKTIERYLGGNYKVTASMGHLRDLPKSKMGVDIEHGFEPQYIQVRDKTELINELCPRNIPHGNYRANSRPQEPQKEKRGRRGHHK